MRPVASWCAGNAAAGFKDDAVKWFKDESADKIDPIVSDSIAVGRAVIGWSEYADSSPIYGDDGLLQNGTFL